MTSSRLPDTRISNRMRGRFVLGALAGAGLSRFAVPAAAGRAQDDATKVTATTGQVADLAAIVGGDLVAVTGLMGPGVDPHLYKPSADDVSTLIESEIVFYNGLFLEGNLGEVLEQVERRKTVSAVSDGVPEDQLIQPEDDAFYGNPDPHFWFDPTLWSLAAGEVARVFAGQDEDNAQTYGDNAAAYQQELAKLDAYAAEQFATIPERSRILVTAHDAFGYLGRRYGLEVVGLQGISTATEAGVRDVQTIADLLVANEVQAIFVETSVPERTIESLQVAARDRGWDVAIGGSLYSDAMGDAGTEEGTYLGMMRYDIDTIVQGLAGDVPS